MSIPCSTLSELPPPLAGKTGWPWTEESEQLPDVVPDGRALPRVIIVTPSYPPGKSIEETIRSVLLHGSPDLQYMVVDGGNADGSVTDVPPAACFHGRAELVVGELCGWLE